MAIALLTSMAINLLPPGCHDDHGGRIGGDYKIPVLSVAAIRGCKLSLLTGLPPCPSCFLCALCMIWRRSKESCDWCVVKVVTSLEANRTHHAHLHLTSLFFWHWSSLRYLVAIYLMELAMGSYHYVGKEKGHYSGKQALCHLTYGSRFQLCK
jgi:hypothetical protein